MELFLQILGVLCLIAIALLLVPVAWLAYKLWKIRQAFRKFMASLGDIQAMMVPPLRVKLRRVTRPDWTDRGAIEQLAGPLRADGFQDVGIYDVDPAAGLRLMALVHPGHEAYAAIYQQPGQPVWLDLVSQYADGRIVCYSTSSHAALLDTPPFKILQALPDAEAAELLARFLAERPAGPRQPVAAESFAADFEAAWARESDWRAERGGVTDAEIRRLAGRDGNPVSEETVSNIRQHWHTAINGHYQQQLQDAFLASGQISAREWEHVRDRTLFVHDRLSWDEVVNVASLALDIDRDDEADRRRHDWEEIERLAAGLAPREAFERINDRLEPPRRYQRIGQLHEPVATDVYVSPEEEFEGEDFEEEEDAAD